MDDVRDHLDMIDACTDLVNGFESLNKLLMNEWNNEVQSESVTKPKHMYCITFHEDDTLSPSQLLYTEHIIILG